MATPDLTLVSESTLPAHLDATLTSARGYADTKKNEAITAAATDATTKANTAKTDAISDATTKYGGLPGRMTTVEREAVNGTRLTTEDLNSVMEPGEYFQPMSADATAARNYPFIGADAACTLTVRAYTDNANNINRIQIAMPMNGEGMAVRTFFAGAVKAKWKIFRPSVGTRLTTQDLNTVMEPAHYFQPLSSDATAARNYPFIGADAAGSMTVDAYTDNANNINRVQTYIPMNVEGFAIRTFFAGALKADWQIFRPWQEPLPPEPQEPDHGVNQHMVRLNDMRRRIGRPATEGRAAVALVVDHGTNNFNEIIVPLLQETGVRATIALNFQMYDPSMQRYQHDNRTNWGIVKSWHDNLGVEIANHGRTHKDQFTVEDIKTEIIGGRDELEANLPGVKVDTYVQVGLSGTESFLGFNNGTTIESYYETAAGRIIVDGHALYTGSLPGSRVFDLDGEPKQGVNSYWIDTGAASIATAKAQIALAVVQGKGVTIRIHPELLDTAGCTTTAEVSEFLRHLGSLIAAGSIVPMTLREFNLATSGSGVHMSPDGSRFRIAVGDDGALSSIRL